MVIKRYGKYILDLDDFKRYLVLVDVGKGPLFGISKFYSNYYQAIKKFEELVKINPIYSNKLPIYTKKHYDIT